MIPERGEVTTGICFGNKGPLRRIFDGDGNRIIYPVLKSEFPVELDVFHPNGVNGAGVDTEPLQN